MNSWCFCVSQFFQFKIQKEIKGDDMYETFYIAGTWVFSSLSQQYIEQRIPIFGWGNWLSEETFVEFRTAKWRVETEDWSLCFNIHTISALPEVSWLGSQSPGTRETPWPPYCGESVEKKGCLTRWCFPVFISNRAVLPLIFFLLCTLKIITQENSVHYLKLILQGIAL